MEIGELNGSIAVNTNFSDLTIIAIPGSRKEHYIFYSPSCYIQVGKKSLIISGVTIRNTAILRKNAIV